MSTTVPTSSRGIGGHQRPYRGFTDDWLTPPEILKALGPFDLDPCCPKSMPWETATAMYTAGGLDLPWSGRVWMNPPYGPSTGKWLKRLAEHGNGIALVFARTETAMFHEWGWRCADAMLFLKGRIHFHYPDGERAPFNAGAPSVLIAYGMGNVRALRRSGIAGQVVSLSN